MNSILDEYKHQQKKKSIKVMGGYEALAIEVVTQRSKFMLDAFKHDGISRHKKNMLWIEQGLAT
jgi:hypothetical protein